MRQSTAVVGAITPQESVSGGVWTAYHDEPISDILVYQVTETRTVPGLYVPFTRYDLLLGPIVGTRRLVENSGLTTSLTATTKTTYDAHENSKVVCWELIETNSDGTGSDGNPAFPVRIEDSFEPDRGAIEKRMQVVIATGGEAGSLDVGSTLQTLILDNAGSGYAPGDTITLAGGTFTTASTLTVSTTKVVTASLVSAGAGFAPGIPGSTPMTGTTGAGTKVRLSASVDASGTILSVSVTGFGTNSGGSYTANPTNLSAEPLTHAGLIGAPPTVLLTMGVATFTIDDRGLYTATSASLTQASTSGSGTGATFNTATYATQARLISYQPIDQFKLDRSVEIWTIPGPTLRTGERYDRELGLVTSTKQLVDGTSNPAQSESATGLTKYEASSYGNPVVWKIVESWETASFPTVQENLYDRERGAIKRTAILTTDLTTAGSLAASANLVTEIRYEPRNAYLRKLITETFAYPGPVLTGEPKIDDDGATITTTRNLEIASAITEGEIVGSGVWTMTTSEPYSGQTTGPLRWKVTQARPLAADATCPIIREDRWNDQFNTVMATFRQYVPEGTTKQVIGASYSTADTYVSNSITALTVSDPGSGYLTIPTLTISASPGGGTLATATVTNLQAVSATIVNPGSGYAIGDVLTGATGTGTPATFTVAGGKLATVTVSAAGTGYVATEVVTLAGGLYSIAGTIQVNTIKLVSTAINAAGTGYTSGGTVTLAGGTATTKAIVSIATLKLNGLSVNSGGADYAPGDTVQLDSGTASTKAVVTVSTVDGGGAILTFSITTAGSYTSTSTTHTSTATSGIGTGATFNAALYGILTFTITTAGSYTVGATTFTQDSATGGGTGATFQTGVFGINTITILNTGAYSSLATTSFTQASTTGSGTGATFGSATYTVNALTVLTGGAYTVVASNPDSLTGGTGTGLTATLDYGIGAVSLGTAGTLYYYPPTITPSYGNALILPTMSTPILQAGTLTGYVVDTGLVNTEHSKIKRLVWSTMFKPPSRVERATRQFPLPNVFTWLSNWDLHPPTGLTKHGPFSGVNFTNVDNGVSVSPSRCLISYSLGPSESIPKTWQVITPGVSSILFRIGPNTIHNSWVAIETNGSYTQLIELMPASTPASYVRGQSLIVEVTERKVIGNFYERRIHTIN